MLELRSLSPNLEFPIWIIPEFPIMERGIYDTVHETSDTEHEISDTEHEISIVEPGSFYISTIWNPEFPIWNLVTCKRVSGRVPRCAAGLGAGVRGAV